MGAICERTDTGSGHFKALSTWAMGSTAINIQYCNLTVQVLFSVPMQGQAYSFKPNME